MPWELCPFFLQFVHQLFNPVRRIRRTRFGELEHRLATMLIPSPLQVGPRSCWPQLEATVTGRLRSDCPARAGTHGPRAPRAGAAYRGQAATAGSLSAAAARPGSGLAGPPTTARPATRRLAPAGQSRSRCSESLVLQPALRPRLRAAAAATVSLDPRCRPSESRPDWGRGADSELRLTGPHWRQRH